MTRSWIVGLLLGVSGLFHYASSEASELDHQKTLEETFLETAPASTVRVTKGVYAVDYSSSLKMVHTFGIDGLIYDIENLRQRIANAKSKARDTSALEAAVQVLEGRLEKMQSDSIASKGLRSGSCGQQYDFEMEAYFVPALVGGVTTARVKVEKSPFGPFGPGEVIDAYVLAIAHSAQGEFENSVSGSSQQGGEIEISTASGCGSAFSCTYWEAYMSFYVPSCGHRGYNPSGNI